MSDGPEPVGTPGRRKKVANYQLIEAQKMDTRPARYTVKLAIKENPEAEVDEVLVTAYPTANYLSFKKFRVLVFEEHDFLLSQTSAAAWDTIIKNTPIKVTPVNERDVREEFILEELIGDFEGAAKEEPWGPDDGNLLRHIPLQKDDGTLYLTPKAVLEFVRQKHGQNVSRSAVLSVLKKPPLSYNDERIYVGKRQYRVWASARHVENGQQKLIEEPKAEEATESKEELL